MSQLKADMENMRLSRRERMNIIYMGVLNSSAVLILVNIALNVFQCDLCNYPVKEIFKLAIKTALWTLLKLKADRPHPRN